MASRIIRPAIGAGRPFCYRMGHRGNTTADPNVVAAPGLRGARTQQQTGTNRQDRGSPVSQRSRRNDSHHLLTNRSVLPRIRTPATAARENSTSSRIRTAFRRCKEKMPNCSIRRPDPAVAGVNSPVFPPCRRPSLAAAREVPAGLHESPAMPPRRTNPYPAWRRQSPMR